MIDVLHLDYETLGRVDLILHGAYNYATSLSTGIHCAGWAINNNPVQLWVPGQPVPEPIIEIFERGAPRSIHAHNAQFERLITWYVLCPEFDVPEPPLEAFYCTAAQARRRALPGALENLGKALKLGTQKSLAGKQLIRKLCIPWKNGKINFEEGEFNRDPVLLQELYDYCEIDVEVERAAAEMSPPLTDEEFADYVISEKINDRGLLIDFDLAAAAAQYAEEETAAIGEELAELTGGIITRPRQFQRLKDYLEPYAAEDDVLRKMLTRYKTDRKTKETTKKQSLDKTARSNILLSDHEFDPAVISLVELIDEAGRSSTSKFTAMCMRADEEDDRVRGAYMKDGAVQTGRFSSLGLQVHNFTRDCAEDPEAVRENIIKGEAFHNVMDTLASMLRPAIMAAPDHEFVCGDWSSIEARVLPWLAKADHILDEYREIDANPDLPDMYEREAARMSMDDRQIGKVAILSLGFQGALRALQAMARNYGIHIEDEFGDKVVKRWRGANKWAPNFWYACIGAAKKAMKHPGYAYDAKRLFYVYDEDWDTLWCILPSGKALAYPQPRLQGGDLTCIKANWKPAAGETEWPRVDLYGGLLAENATQAVSAEILQGGLRLMEEYDWPVVGHTHDEILCEVLDDEVDECEQTLRWVMLTNPEWSEGLPLNCSLWAGKRYRK